MSERLHLKAFSSKYVTATKNLNILLLADKLYFDDIIKEQFPTKLRGTEVRMTVSLWTVGKNLSPDWRPVAYPRPVTSWPQEAIQ